MGLLLYGGNQRRERQRKLTPGEIEHLRSVRAMGAGPAFNKLARQLWESGVLQKDIAAAVGLATVQPQIMRAYGIHKSQRRTLARVADGAEVPEPRFTAERGEWIVSGWDGNSVRVDRGGFGDEPLRRW